MLLWFIKTDLFPIRLLGLNNVIVYNNIKKRLQVLYYLIERVNI
jgi:hypothetical protein